jgi:hypothetical protein
MRCPYCGGLNQERAVFCTNCGRDMREFVHQAPNAPAQQGYPSQSVPQRPPAQQVHQSQPVPQRPNAQAPAPATRRQPAPAQTPPRVATLVQPAPPPSAPEPPVLFPPRAMAQLEALLTNGAQSYTVVESHIGDGQKKIVRIAYPACAHWQQAATLFKAFKEQQEEKFNMITIQGVLPQQESYGFTNGQLQFDRGVRLGGRIGNRYVIETGNGYASDSIRFMLNE